MKRRNILGSFGKGDLGPDRVHHRSERRKANRILGRANLDRIQEKAPDHSQEWFKAKNRADGGPNFRISDFQKAYPPARCEHCGDWFLTKRRDAKTCSGKCRMALSRERQKTA